MNQLMDHWLNEIEISDLLTGDMKLVYDHCGRDVLIRLWEAFPGIAIYISSKSLHAARARYIARHYDGHNIKKLAVQLRCSELFVHRAVNEKRSKHLPPRDER